MRKIIVQEFITLDGVMQAPGGTEEDTESNFQFGGWTAPYFHEADQEGATFMERWMQSTDILLGEKTFKIWEKFWPTHEDMWPGINAVKKYVLSPDLEKTDWNNTIFLRSVDEVKTLKNGDGGDIKVHGSANMAQSLFKNDLVDELCLMIFPITLGQGKRLFQEGTIPAAFRMTDHKVTKNGVILAYYERAGEVQTGEIAG
jgi:dihydrofolate reductase